MDLSVQTYNSINFNFLGVSPQYSKKNLDKIFYPLLQDRNITKEDFVKKSGLSYDIAFNWCKETFGITLNKLFIKRFNENIKRDVIFYRAEGLTDDEIANIYGKSKHWLGRKLREINETRRQKQQKLMYNNIPWMINAGYTINRIVSELNLSASSVYRWIHSHLENGLTKYRLKNNIPIFRDNMSVDFISKFKAYFDNGGSIRGAKNEFNMSRDKVCRLMERYNIKSKRQKAYEYMLDNLQDRMDKNVSLSKMSKEFGVSESLIAAAIQKQTGMDYKELRIKNICNAK